MWGAAPARDGKAKFPRVGRWQACCWGSAALRYKMIVAAAAAAAFVVAVWAVRAKPSVTAPCVDPLGRNAFILR